jgi:hypothetical protein
MTKIISDHKKKFSQKLLEFQKTGLVQYGKYLDQQLKITAKMPNNQLYKKYIEDQIILNNKRIKSIDDKL